VTDLSQVTNAVTATSIRHGDPLTVNDFTASNVSQTAYLSGDQRAITLTLDASHGLTGILQSGNTVDIIRIAPSSGHPVMLAEGITILANTGGNVTLRVTDKQALAIAQAQETDKIWLALRPSVGAISTVPPLIKVS
jgi:Flp pilus assembly protein CpaB